jgi:hypothetical protein
MSEIALQMDPTLKEVYKFVLQTWPLVAGAYAILWLGLMAFIGFALKRVSGLGKQLEVLEAAIARRNAAE